MLVTNVGGLADTVPNNKVGIVVEPTVDSIAEGIITLYQNGECSLSASNKNREAKIYWEQMT
jgi:glycosyltransferase involved in cell wall biosynthesis